MYKIILNHVNVQLLTSVSLFSDFLLSLITASSDQHNLGLIRHRNINNISYET